jgi:glycerophosphoryl diester phosphodiesterase
LEGKAEDSGWRLGGIFSIFAGLPDSVSLVYAGGMRSWTALALLSLSTISPPGAQGVEIIAHRGSSAIAPENTVNAFRLAWAQGADACENDIYLTKDGKIAVIHDADTKRTTGTSMRVSESSLAALQALDAGSFKGQAWRGEKIPSLSEALATMPVGRQRFLIEIKCGPEIVPALSAVLTPMQARAEQLCVISFNLAAAKLTKEQLPWVKVYYLASGKKQGAPRTDLADLISAAKAAQLDGLNLGADWEWNAAMVQQIRAAGLGVYVWTVDAPAEARRLAALGVDGITTNHPGRVRQALQGEN